MMSAIENIVKKKKRPSRRADMHEKNNACVVCALVRVDGRHNCKGCLVFSRFVFVVDGVTNQFIQTVPSIRVDFLNVR